MSFGSGFGMGAGFGTEVGFGAGVDCALILGSYPYKDSVKRLARATTATTASVRTRWFSL
jgi:hypothetical protein